MALYAWRLAAAALVAAATVPAQAAAARAESPWSATASAAPVRDVVLSRAAARRLAGVTWWGGVYTTTGGDRVTVHLSGAYPRDDAVAQRWADYLGSLVHASELASVSLYLAPLADVQEVCSAEADGCYDGSRIVSVGDSSAGIPPTSVVAHEYGHHVAEHRLNPPWRAIDAGPKRWATAVGVCSRTAAGTAFPGDEGLHYSFNPGEAWAESYRVLNETRGGLPLTWGIVDRSFAPTPALLQAVSDDVLHPWTGPTTQRIVGGFRGTATTWQLTVATPLDGDLDVSLAVPPGTADSLALLGTDGRQLAVGLLGGDGRMLLHSTICGARSVVLRVRRAGGDARTFTLRVTRP